MAMTWKIRFDTERTEVITLAPKEYHFFLPDPQMDVVEEPTVAYGSKALDFHETSVLFEFLDYTNQDIAELLEVDPSTLFRWKKEDRKLSKSLSKNLLEMDQIIAKGIRIFGSEEGLSEWLQLPNTALGNQKPAELLKNPYQIARVDQTLEALSWGIIL
jgi:putative toxin-antitoxin system antitoxin component (TIGR02293 family)